MKKITGGVTAAKGFEAASTAAKIKYQDRTDMAMIYSQVPCECAVFAVGFLANDSHPLAEVCEKRKLPYYVIGDAKSARRALDAIAEGFEVARTL